MIKYVCDCCGSESFKEMTKVNSLICGVRCVCDDCLETVMKKIAVLEENAEKGLIAVTGAAAMEAFKLFEAANTAKLFGDGESGLPSEEDIRNIGSNILRGRATLGAINHGSLQPQHLGTVLNYDNSAYTTTDTSSIAVSKDYITDTVKEYLAGKVKDIHKDR